MQARFVSDLGEKAKVPIISFSATSPSLNSSRNSYFLRATQNDSAQVNAIGALVEAFGWREAVPIYIDNEYGEGIIPYLIDALQEVDAHVPYRSVISPSATNGQIAEELYKLMTMQTRVFIVHMNRSLGARLFTKAKEIGMMSEGYVWIMTDGLSVDFLNSPNHTVIDTIQGVLGIKPYVPRTKELEYFRARWKRKFLQHNPDKIDAKLNIYGLLAYDATTALALAVEQSGATKFVFQKANVSSNSSTDLATLGTSLNGPKLQSPALRIVNVNGNGERGIGFWTPATGLGWEIPTNEKKLRIGVPVNYGFTLPYALPYEFIAFAKPDGKPAGTYNDLVYQVYLKNYDAVVGDVTIVFNRSLYIDYTLPFTESGVSMIVPIADSNTKNAWVFMKPLTWDLWVVSFLFFLFFGFVVWVLEHRINEDFRGSASHQAGTSFWFSFSTMVFAQRNLLSLVNFPSPVVLALHEGSFVRGLLLDLGFKESKLMVYGSPEECHHLFSKGSGNGGIAAAFDELAFIKLILSRYCSKYTMIDLKFKTGGLGFVFPKGSPLVPHISRAILNVTEGDKMEQIENAWFRKNSRLVASLALIIFLVMFVYRERNILRSYDSTASIWSRIENFFRIFIQRDSTSSTFRQSELNGRNGISMPPMCAPSPSAYSVHTEYLADQSSKSYDSSPNRQSSQEVVVADNGQLTNQNQERPAALEIDHENL
ncbi:hypothetical protein OIU76_008656 [Salix suchowensis]|nr:hypothetical protein OIU76_008656 [Salix suchowensis]